MFKYQHIFKTPGKFFEDLFILTTNFNITDSDYTGAPTYDLSNYIKIPQTAESEVLQFGDERFFFGNVEATGLTYKYRTNVR